MAAIIEFPLGENEGMGKGKFFRKMSRFSILRPLGRQGSKGVHGRRRRPGPGRAITRPGGPPAGRFQPGGRRTSLRGGVIKAKNLVAILDRNISNVMRILVKFKSKTSTAGRTRAIFLLERRLGFLRSRRAELTPSELPIQIALPPAPVPEPTPEPPPMTQPEPPISQPIMRVISTQPKGQGFSGIVTDPTNLSTEIINGITFPIWGDFNRGQLNKAVYLDGYNAVPARSQAVADSQSFRYGRLDVNNGFPPFADVSQVTPMEREIAIKASRDIVSPDPRPSSILGVAGEALGGGVTNVFGGVSQGIANTLGGGTAARAIGSIAPIAVLVLGGFLIFGRRRR